MEGLHHFQAGKPHLAAGALIAAPGNGRRNSLDITGLNQNSVILDHFRNTAHRGGNDGAAIAHGLQDADGQAFVVRGQDKDI